MDRNRLQPTRALDSGLPCKQRGLSCARQTLPHLKLPRRGKWSSFVRVKLPVVAPHAFSDFHAAVPMLFPQRPRHPNNHSPHAKRHPEFLQPLPTPICRAARPYQQGPKQVRMQGEVLKALDCRFSLEVRCQA